MPQPVALQYSDQSVGLPANYTLPPGQAFDFSSVTARINGAGASGAFLVVLDLLSQDDKVIASSRIDQEFAAGDTAVVSFAPDFRRKATSTPPVGGTLSVAALSASGYLPGAASDVPWDSFSTNDPATFDTAAVNGGPATNTPGDKFLRLASPGVYVVNVGARWGGAAKNGRFITISVSGSVPLQGIISAADSATWLTNSIKNAMDVRWQEIHGINVPSYVSLNAGDGGSGDDLDGAMGVAYWPAAEMSPIF